MHGYRKFVVVITGVIVACFLDGCSSHAAAPSSHMPINGLCAFVDNHAISKLVTGDNDDAYMMSTPANPAAGQTARCQFAGVDDIPVDSYDMSVSPAVQHGQDVFAKLAANSSFKRENVNGVDTVWDSGSETLYVRFTDKNQSLVGRSQQDSVLSVNYRPDVEDSGIYTRDNVEQPLLSFVGHAIADINGGQILNPASASPKDEPVLVDDRGHPIDNPILVMQVYQALKAGDQLALGDLGGGDQLWNTTQAPILAQAKVRTEVMRSMTVHPNCDDFCTYPDFAIAGWGNKTARADGLKLGIDPTEVTDPRLGHQLPVYTSEFGECMCAWQGVDVPIRST